MDNPNVKILEKKHICSFCDFKTHKKYNLDLHVKNKHAMLTNRAPVTMSFCENVECAPTSDL